MRKVVKDNKTFTPPAGLALGFTHGKVAPQLMHEWRHHVTEIFPIIADHIDKRDSNTGAMTSGPCIKNYIDLGGHVGIPFLVLNGVFGIENAFIFEPFDKNFDTLVNTTANTKTNIHYYEAAVKYVDADKFYFCRTRQVEIPAHLEEPPVDFSRAEDPDAEYLKYLKELEKNGRRLAWTDSTGNLKDMNPQDIIDKLGPQDGLKMDEAITDWGDIHIVSGAEEYDLNADPHMWDGDKHIDRNKKELWIDKEKIVPSVVKLEDILNPHMVYDLCKMDIEGSEYEVLENSSILNNYTKFILLDFHYKKEDEIRQFLKDKCPNLEIMLMKRRGGIGYDCVLANKSLL